jgi:Uma2 family endonuclease
MAAPQEHLIFTEEQYLEFERKSEERHEYLDGHIYLMAGESGEHGDICTNLSGLLFGQLRGKPCRVRSKDTKVRSGPQTFAPRGTKGLYSYPDIVVICGEPQYLDKHRDVVTNPRVIIEVLSEKTNNFDRNEKFMRYRMWNETLTDYVLVSQFQPFVEHFERRKSGEWVYHSYQGLDQKIPIKSIKCTLAMADVYDRVVFPVAKKKATKKARSPRKTKKTTSSR